MIKETFRFRKAGSVNSLLLVAAATFALGGCIGDSGSDRNSGGAGAGSGGTGGGGTGGGGTGGGTGNIEKKWHEPIRVDRIPSSPDQTGGSQDPEVALTDNGTALVVWNQRFGTSEFISSSVHSAGEWSTPKVVGSGGRRSDYLPSVAFDDSGNALSVWFATFGIRTYTWANRYTSAKGWGNEEQLVTPTDPPKGTGIGPQVAFDSKGNAIAVWHYGDGARTNIWASRYELNKGWKSPEMIETNDLGNAVGPQVDFADNGNAMAIWHQFDGSRTSIWSSYYDAANGWSAPVLAESDNEVNASHPQVKFMKDGTALAVWLQKDANSFSIWANKYSVGTGWGTPLSIDTTAAGNSVSPELAGNGEEAQVVWQRTTDSNVTGVLSSRYTKEKGWSAAEVIEDGKGGYAIKPQVALSADNSSVVVWSQQGSNERYSIWSRRYLPGKGWSDRQLLEANDTLNANKPQVAIDAKGNALAVWEQGFDIWVSHFK